MRHNTRKQFLALIVCVLLLVCSIGITVAEGEPELWVGGVQVTEANASDIFGDGKVSFDASTNTLTFAANNPSLSGLHNGALIDAVGMDTLNIAAPNGLTLRSSTATKGISVESGALTINGKINAMIDTEDLDAVIWAKNGLTATGNLDLDGSDGMNYHGTGIVCPDGPVSIAGDVFAATENGINCSGSVTVTGDAIFFVDTWADNTASIRTSGSVDVGTLSFSGNSHYVIYADGDILVRGATEIANGFPIGGRGIYSSNGKIECRSNVSIDDTTNKTDIFLYAGGEAGILIEGNASLSSGRIVEVPAAFTAPNGPITVNGDLSIKCGGLTAVLAKGDITVAGNATVKNQLSQTTTKPYNGKAISSTAGSISVTGDLTSNSSDSCVYAYNSISVGGNLTAGVSLLQIRDYILKAENGAVNIDGKLVTTGVAQNVVYGKTGITVGEVAVNEVFRDEMDPTGCYVLNAPDGSVTANAEVNITTNPAYGYSGTIAGAEFGVVAGDTINIAAKWDVTASRVALQAANGIVKPNNYGVTTPQGGRIMQLTDGATVTEADGAAVAAHAVIEEVELITITLDPCNEGESEAITVEIPVGGTIAEFPTVAYSGHKLIGWFADSRTGLETGTGTQVTAETVFDANTTIYANWYLPGDVNGDGKVNNKDVNRLLQYLAGDNVEVVLFACDVNGDGKINNKDVNRLLQYLAGDDVEIF